MYIKRLPEIFIQEAFLIFEILFGSHCNQLPLIERLPQWLSGPSSSLSVPCRTARGLPYQIQTMFGRAVFYSTISIDDINAQSGWSLKTEKIHLKWHICFDTTHTIRHLFLTWTSLYPSLHFLNLTQSYAALPLAFFYFDLHCLSELYLGTYPPVSNIN